jgi:hypothetical protein
MHHALQIKTLANVLPDIARLRFYAAFFLYTQSIQPKTQIMVLHFFGAQI